MIVCQSCGGIIGRDCWNPQECAEITASMASQPQSRDEAQPVAWLVTNKATGHEHLLWQPLADLPFNRERFSTAPLYTHPAPDALRVALEEARDAVTFFDQVKAATQDEQIAVGRDHWNRMEAALRRLAALQAEQKGGAA